MSNYVQSTNFATKDSLPSGDPLKIVKGTEINTEFANIAIAVATKADLNSPTLVTPALGTPSSGTLTNCTSLPIDGGTTGTLPVSRGGTGVTTSTGSGNVVLSTSPTLVTPALGTPSSGNLANCTFPTLNQNTTGNAATATTATTATTVSTTVASGATGTTQAFGTNNTTMATTAFVQAALQLLYPVGTIYSSTVSTNPATLFGFGTWVAYAAGRVLIGDGGGFTAGTTGGSADAVVVSHTHTAASTDLSGTFYAANRAVAAPTGTFSFTGNTTDSSLSGGGLTGDIKQYQFSGNHTHTINSTGSSGTNANLQPYVVVYMWQRTA